MMDDLPTDHDVIVVGTGMPESIVAAAIARIGQRVLHLDKESHYGSLWANYNFTSLREWMFNAGATSQESPDVSSFEALLNPGENCLITAHNHKSVFNAKEIINVPDVIPECQGAEPTPSASTEASDHAPGSAVTAGDPALSASSDSQAENYSGNFSCLQLPEVTQCFNPESDSANNNDATEAATPTVVQEEGTSVVEPTGLDGESAGSSVDATFGSATQCGDSSPEGTSEDNVAAVLQNDVPATTAGSPKPQVKEEWSLAKISQLSRKFNLDLAPKLLFSRGPMVELLISSNIARYAEFKALTRILTLQKGQLQQVPCSRADVFSCKHVSVIEKRMLMKYLTFCKEFELHPDEYRGFEGVPFLQFLKSRDLTANVEHYVLHAIAMVDSQTPTLQGLKATQKFLESLGRYGNSPFLASLYGSGELPQCFCRLCAVYGGIYHLQRGPGAIVQNEQGACVGIISNGRRFNCKWLVMESSYAPAQLKTTEGSQRVSRAILITDKSLYPADKEHITLLRVPQSDDAVSSVLVQEQGPGMMVCPSGLYVVHLTCTSAGENAEQDLQPIVKLLFNASSFEASSAEEETKPRALYILYFNTEDSTKVQLNQNSPPGLILVSSPGPYLDYEHPVREAREVFHTMYPNEEFLPRAPDPEEILIEYENNPGDHDAPTDADEMQPNEEGKPELGPDAVKADKEESNEKDNEPESGKGDDVNVSNRASSACNSDGASFSGDS